MCVGKKEQFDMCVPAKIKIERLEKLDECRQRLHDSPDSVTVFFCIRAAADEEVVLTFKPSNNLLLLI